MSVNIEVRCHRCGEWILVAVKRLKWIRCPSCGTGVEIALARKRTAGRGR